MKLSKLTKSRMSTLLIVVFSYLGFCALLYVMQRGFIYFPDNVIYQPSEVGMPEMSRVSVQTEDGLDISGFYAPPADESKPVLVSFHGNAGSVAFRGYLSKPFTQAGYGFLLAEYRGYGGNPGKHSEEGFYKDAEAYLQFLKEQGIPESRTVLYGESLGTGVAVEMAKRHKGYKAVVLLSPYTSLVDIAKIRFFMFPLKLMMKDQFNSIDKIKDVDTPLMVVHGQLDTIVPHKYGKRLHDAANEPKTLHTVPLAGHNDLSMHGTAERIMHFLSGLQ